MYVIEKLKSNYFLCLFLFLLISSFLHLFPAFQHSLWKSSLCFFIYHSIPLSPCSSFFSLLTHRHYLSISSPHLSIAPPLSLSFQLLKPPNVPIPTPLKPIHNPYHLPLLSSSLLCFVSIVLRSAVKASRGPKQVLVDLPSAQSGR